MTLPGVNYAKKPYQDDNSSMPNIGATIVNLDSGTTDVRGTVLATNASTRTVSVDAVIKDPVTGRSSLVAMIAWQLWSLP
jgi:hypothetical protein